MGCTNSNSHKTGKKEDDKRDDEQLNEQKNKDVNELLISDVVDANYSRMLEDIIGNDQLLVEAK